MNGEYDQVFRALFARLDKQDEKLDALGTDVASLLQSRSFVRGAWKAITVISVAVSTLVGILIAFVKGH